MKSIELNKLEYNGDLGAKYSKESTKFTLWAPTANEVSVYLYEDEKSIPMVKGDKGQWEVVIDGDLKNKFYNYKVKINEKINTVVDPYAYAVGVNGEKSMVVDLESTNPKGWENDIKPEFKNATDAIIYEMHVRDFTIDESSEVEKEFRGKFKGISQKNPISHLKELGVTHVQLMPISDYKSVDESKMDELQYNWGYDPQNYNVPEGSYSTNPNDGNVRIKEFKELVKALHEEGIRVIMDVVYNHTYDTETSLFNLAVPNYYYRTDEEGNFTNGSGCGNEVASQKPMVRRYIKDSVVNWAKEYHIDGFRFDLMGLHDIETIIQIREELDKIDKSILVYGEGWAGGATPLKEDEAALKLNAPKFGKNQIGCFSDDIRDGVKGDVFIAKSTGFVNGGENFEETIKFGIVASTKHSQVDYSKVIYSDKPWANEPYQTITYASAHDNYTLWDKLQLTVDDDSINKEEKLIKMNKLVASIVLTSQGISLIHAGEEISRTKVNEDGSLVENSYKSPDSVNKFDWNRKDKYKDVFNYYSGLIKLRKTYKEFRLTSNEDIEREVRFLENNQSKVVLFTISNKIVVIHNANEKDITAIIPQGSWSVLVDAYKAGIEELSCINGNEVKVPALASYVLVRK